MASLTIGRPHPAVLVVAGRRLPAAGGLAVLAAVTLLFWSMALFPEPGPAVVGGSGPRLPADSGAWLLLLVPFALAPYWLRCLRTLRRGDVLTVDGRARTLTRHPGMALPFDRIRQLEIRAVNSTCEEIALGLVLADGQRITLAIEGRAAEMEPLANVLAAGLGVEVVREY
jgi:hypothetical protein